MAKWETMKVHDDIDRVNELGQDGWEPFAVTIPGPQVWLRRRTDPPIIDRGAEGSDETP